jgi:hypothetical protein
MGPRAARKVSFLLRREMKRAASSHAIIDTPITNSWGVEGGVGECIGLESSRQRAGYANRGGDVPRRLSPVRQALGARPPPARPPAT